MNTPKILAIAAASAGLAFTASPALADPYEVPTENVSLAGIDLDTVEGQEILDNRIERATRRVCRADYVRTGTRIASTATRSCVAKARARAQRQVATIMENQRRGG